MNVWFQDKQVAARTTSTELSPLPLGSEESGLIRITFCEPVAIVPKLLEMDGGVVPVLASPRLGNEGFSWIVYKNEQFQQLSPSAALDKLRKLGFKWIIVPFYGNDHFVRGCLGLRPVYQDQWLQAFAL